MDKQCNGCFSYYDDELSVCPYCGYFYGAQPGVANHLFVGTELAGRYVIGNVLGFGGFGVTYKAWDKKLDTVVAVKEYYPANFVNRVPGTESVIVLSGNAKYQFDHGLSNFIDEARNIAKFGLHKNIVNVFEYFEANNTAYIVMEFLSGCNLKKRVDDCGGRISSEECLHYIFNVLNALKDIHAGGIIHRDISPDNIFLCTNGSVKLIDFGAARLSSTDEARNYTVILKRGFAPPEQYEHISDQGPATDIYALGATMYYCLTGQRPVESITRKISDTLLSPNEIDADIEVFVSDAIMKAMSLEPELRFSDAAEFEKSLRKEIKIKKPETIKRNKTIKRRITVALMLAVFVALFSFLTVKFVSNKFSTLSEPTEIVISYAVNDSNGDGLKAVYDQIINDFCREYPNVKIIQKPFEESDYELFIDEVISGKRKVNLFISLQKNNEAPLSEDLLLDLSLNSEFPPMLYSDKGDKYHFPDFQTVTMPTAINIPVVYVNTSCSVADISSVADFEDLETVVNEEFMLLVDKECADEFEVLFGDASSDYIVYGTCEQFISGEYAAFFSDTSNYNAVKKMPSMLTGIPKVAQIDIDNLPCSFNELWSIKKSTVNAENEVALYFLEFLLSEKAQSRLFGTGQINDALPINLSALQTFLSVYTDIAFIIDK